MAANSDASRFALRGRKGWSPLFAAAGSSYKGVFRVKAEAL